MLKKSVTKSQYSLTRVHLVHQLSSQNDISYSHVGYLSIIHSLFAWVSLFPDVATPALTQPWQNWWGLLKLFRSPGPNESRAKPIAWTGSLFLSDSGWCWCFNHSRCLWATLGVEITQSMVNDLHPREKCSISGTSLLVFVFFKKIISSFHYLFMFQAAQFTSTSLDFWTFFPFSSKN